MIYTCTMNTSIDYLMKLHHLNLGEVNHSYYENALPGGKGVNTSIVLSNLGIESTLLGFIGGFTGDYLMNLLKDFPYTKPRFISVDGNTRINLIVEEKIETVINASGPSVGEQDYQRLISQVNELKSEDVFILSGSVPQSLKKDCYAQIAKILHDKEILFLVDAKRDYLLSTLPYQPFLIKPNQRELEDLFNVNITNDEEVIHYATILRTKGAQNVLVSLGGDGAILVTENKVYRSNTPIGKVINTVGAGDSMVAGFIANYLKTKSYPLALQLGCACGTSTAFSLGLGRSDVINSLYGEIEIKEIK